MDIARYLEVLGRRKFVVLLTFVAALGAATVGTSLMSPVYSASSLLRISETRSGPVGYSDLNYAQRLQNTYVHLLRGRTSMESVIQDLGLAEDPDDLSDMIKVEAVPSTELIKVTVTGRDANEAARISDAVAALATRQQQPPYTIAVVEPAVAPTSPVRPRPELYIPIGALAGLLGGLGLAFLMENLDRTIRSAERAAAASKAPLLGWIPTFRRRQRRGDASLLDRSDGSAATEAFRSLSATTLARLAEPARSQEDHQPGTILLVASAEPRVGRSTVVVNLAEAMAREGNRVVVVGSDLRHPDVCAAFGITEGPARIVVALGPNHVTGALKETRLPEVKVLPADSLSGSDELPRPDRMKALLEGLARISDVVILDSPAVLASADAAVLAPLADAIILVAGRDQSTERNLALAREQLEAAGGRVLGVVFNRAQFPGDGDFYSYRRRAKSGRDLARPVVGRGTALGAGEDARPREEPPKARRRLEKAG